MRCHGHGSLTTGHDDLRITGCDLLHAERHGAKTGAAELVETPGGCLLRHACLHGRLTGRVPAFTGGQHLAEDHLVHFLRLYPGARKNSADRSRSQFMGSDIGKGAIEGTDRGACGTGDDDGCIAHGISSLSNLRCVETGKASGSSQTGSCDIRPMARASFTTFGALFKSHSATHKVIVT